MKLANQVQAGGPNNGQHQTAGHDSSQPGVNPDKQDSNNGVSRWPSPTTTATIIGTIYYMYSSVCDGTTGNVTCSNGAGVVTKRVIETEHVSYVSSNPGRAGTPVKQTTITYSSSGEECRSPSGQLLGNSGIRGAQPPTRSSGASNARGASFSTPKSKVDTSLPTARLTAVTTVAGHYYSSVATTIGKKAATVPPSYPTTQTGIKLLAGTAYEGNNGGPVCIAWTNTGTYCDSHGTSTTSGQLGNGSSAQQTGPQQVTGYDAAKTATITGLSSAGNYTCAITEGYLNCWGQNDRGQLGIGNTTNQNRPQWVRW